MNRGALIDKYFTNYPSIEQYDNLDEMRERLAHMRDAVVELRVIAVGSHSIKDLIEVQALENDLSKLYVMAEHKRAQRGSLLKA